MDFDIKAMLRDLNKFTNYIAVDVLPTLLDDKDNILFFHYDTKKEGGVLVRNYTHKSDVKEGAYDALDEILRKKMLTQEIEPDHRTLIFSFKTPKATFFTIFENTSCLTPPSELHVAKMWTIVDV